MYMENSQKCTSHWKFCLRPVAKSFTLLLLWMRVSSFEVRNYAMENIDRREYNVVAFYKIKP